MVIPEAFATGLPVIASRIGALETLIDDRENGLLINIGDERNLARTISELVSNSSLEAKLRRGARATYLARYHPEQNAGMLFKIYENCIDGDNQVRA